MEKFGAELDAALVRANESMASPPLGLGEESGEVPGKYLEVRTCLSEGTRKVCYSLVSCQAPRKGGRG